MVMRDRGDRLRRVRADDESGRRERSREEERRGLAGGAGDCERVPVTNAAEDRWQDDAQNRAPLRDAQSEAGLAKVARDEREHLDRRTRATSGSITIERANAPAQALC